MTTEKEALEQILRLTDNRISLAVRKDIIKRILRELDKK